MHHRHDLEMMSSLGVGASSIGPRPSPRGGEVWRLLNRLFEPRATVAAKTAAPPPPPGGSASTGRGDQRLARHPAGDPTDDPTDDSTDDSTEDPIYELIYGDRSVLPVPGRLRRLVAHGGIPKALQLAWLRLADALAAYLDRRGRLGTNRGARFLPHPEVDCADLVAMSRAVEDLALQADGIGHLIRRAVGHGSDLTLSALGIALGEVSRCLDEEAQRMRSAQALLC